MTFFELSGEDIVDTYTCTHGSVALGPDTLVENITPESKTYVEKIRAKQGN